VNLASRILDVASQKDIDAVCSAAFAKLVQDRAKDLGDFEFKGFDDQQQVFAIN
jgi:class 3 adenylate cyclase